MKYFDRIINLTFIYTDVTTFEGTTPEQQHQNAIKFSDSLQTDNPPSRTTIESHRKQLVLKCPKTGIKPRISFQWKRLEDNFCYDCEIRVTNLYMNINPAWVDEILIEAGYVSVTEAQRLQKFNCQVFASYTPQPGPDGYTVFECIIASADSNLFQDQPYTLYLYNGGGSANLDTKKYPKCLEVDNAKNTAVKSKTADGYWTIEGVITKACIDMGLKPVLLMTQQDAEQPFITKDIAPRLFTSGYALIAYLQEQLNAYGSHVPEENRRFQVTTLIFNKTVYFMAISKASSSVVLNLKLTPDAKRVERIPELNLVSSVQWNAGTLSVTSAWLPEIMPATLFKINPKYYQGSKSLPNSVARAETQKAIFDYYYVLTQEVSFSTIGDNTMHVMAVPFQYSPLVNGDTQETNISTSEAFAKYVNLAKEIVEIGFGTQSEQVKKAVDAQKSIASLKLDLLETEATGYTVQPGDNLHQLITKRFNLPAFHGIDTKTNFETNIPADVWAAIICTATQTKMQKNSLYYANVGNPNELKINKMLVIPTKSWSALVAAHKAEIIKACESAYKYYTSTATTIQYAQIYAQLAAFLKNPDGRVL